MSSGVALRRLDMSIFMSILEPDLKASLPCAALLWRCKDAFERGAAESLKN